MSYDTRVITPRDLLEGGYDTRVIEPRSRCPHCQGAMNDVVAVHATSTRIYGEFRCRFCGRITNQPAKLR